MLVSLLVLLCDSVNISTTYILTANGYRANAAVPLHTTGGSAEQRSPKFKSVQKNRAEKNRQANQVKKNQVNKIREEGNFLLIDPETNPEPTLTVNPAAVT